MYKYRCNNQFEYCEKNKSSFFFLSSISSFTLVHNDIWGPTTIPNILSFRWFVSFIDDCT